MPKQSKKQKSTVARVMHEYKHGELRIRGSGPKVKNPRQAVAIALSEAGASNRTSPSRNAHNLRRTKKKERRGETAEAAKEGRQAQRRTLRSASGRSRRSDQGPTKAALYAKAKRRDIPGRSRMSKAELQRALKR
jgi:hypothetical protein